MFTPIGPDDGYDLAELNYMLDQTKTAVFLNSSAAFYGPLLCSMDFMWTNDVPTAATNGATIFWNPKDFLEITPGMRKSTILHELKHVAEMHFIRIGGRDPEDWNIAGDYSINNDLKGDGYEVEMPYFIFDSKYKNWAVEDIYDDVHKQRQCAPWGPGQSQGQPQPGGMGGQPVPGSQPGSPGVRSLAGDMLPATAEDMQKGINNVIQAAHAADAAGDPGSVPGNVRSMIQKFLKSIVPWETVLERFFEELCAEDYSWRRPNRRHSDVYLPSRESDNRLPHMLYGIDVSGSVTDPDILRFNSEIKHIKERYNPEKLTVFQFDTRITKVDIFGEDDSFDEIVVVGRGGTDLRPVRQFILENDPTAVVIFSDLYVDPMEPVDVPIIWVCVGNRGARVKCGQMIHINNE